MLICLGLYSAVFRNHVARAVRWGLNASSYSPRKSGGQLASEFLNQLRGYLCSDVLFENPSISNHLRIFRCSPNSRVSQIRQQQQTQLLRKSSQSSLSDAYPYQRPITSRETGQHGVAPSVQDPTQWPKGRIACINTCREENEHRAFYSSLRGPGNGPTYCDQTAPQEGCFVLFSACG